MPLSVPIDNTQPSHGTSRLDHFESLLNATRALWDSQRPEQTLGRVAESISTAVGAPRVVIGLLDEDRQSLRVGGAYGRGGLAADELGSRIPWATLVGAGTLLTD